MTIKSCFVFMILFLLLLSFTAESSNVLAPPIPARIGGTVTVNGVKLTQANAAGYTIKVTKKDGTAYLPAAEDTDGLNTSDWYIIDIPIYHATDQTGGAKPGDAAVIHVYKCNLELTVTSPSGGQITVGDSGSTTQTDIAVTQPPTNLEPPAIKSLSPKKSSFDKNVKIKGKNFGYCEGKVVIISGVVETESDNILSWSDKEIVIKFSWGIESGEYNIFVEKTGGIRSENGVKFKYITPKPGIKKVSPAKIKAGDEIILKGKNFGPEQGEDGDVTAVGGSVSVKSWSNDSITVTVTGGTGKKLVLNVLTMYGKSNSKSVKVKS